MTGIPVQNQAISAFNTEGDTAPAAVLDDDSKPLGFYGLKDLQILQVSPFHLTPKLRIPNALTYDRRCQILIRLHRSPAN